MKALDKEEYKNHAYEDLVNNLGISEMRYVCSAVMFGDFGSTSAYSYTKKAYQDLLNADDFYLKSVDKFAILDARTQSAYIKALKKLGWKVLHRYTAASTGSRLVLLFHKSQKKVAPVV